MTNEKQARQSGGGGRNTHIISNISVGPSVEEDSGRLDVVSGQGMMDGRGSMAVLGVHAGPGTHQATHTLHMASSTSHV